MSDTKNPKLDISTLIMGIAFATIFTLDIQLFRDDHDPYWMYAVKWLVLAIVLYFPFKIANDRLSTWKDQPVRLAIVSLVSIAGLIVAYSYMA
ncbi:MAG: hypothetical protein Q3976_08590 [Corynebacterium sp.]|nr:hypothetical protein [Corynebacterium sp.]